MKAFVGMIVAAALLSLAAPAFAGNQDVSARVVGVTERNRVEFPNAQAALSAGYRAAHNCP